MEEGASSGGEEAARARHSSAAQYVYARRATAGGLESTRERRGLEELETACFLVHANPESPVSPTTGPHPCHAPTLHLGVNVEPLYHSDTADRCRAARKAFCVREAHGAVESRRLPSANLQFGTTLGPRVCASLPVPMVTSVHFKPYLSPVRRLMLRTHADPSRSTVHRSSRLVSSHVLLL